MNQLLIILGLFVLLEAKSCSQAKNTDSVPTVTPTDSVVVTQSDSFEFNDMANYYVLIADSGLDYYALNYKAHQLSKLLNLDIDSMHRYYNAQKDSIILPENDEDEMYAGDYFPRRFPTESISIEYLSFYMPSSPKTMAIITGIFETQKQADSALQLLKPHTKGALWIQSNIYIGCMH